jgi:hypothetical protein
MALLSSYNYMLGRFSWPEAIEAELKAGLAQVSGKPWREVAALLAAHAEAVFAKYGEEEDDEDEDDSDEDDEDDDDDDSDEDEEEAEEDGANE